MPHITLQFTSNIKSLPNFNKLFSEVHTALNDNAGIKIEN
jgi:5-carboxymethyl-2-hydroxymuconate isomerase